MEGSSFAADPPITIVTAQQKAQVVEELVKIVTTEGVDPDTKVRAAGVILTTSR